MLTHFIENLEEAVERMESDSHRLLGVYFVGELYERQELINKGLSIFGASEHTWRLVLKQSSDKYDSNVSIEFSRQARMFC